MSAPTTPIGVFWIVEFFSCDLLGYYAALFFYLGLIFTSRVVVFLLYERDGVWRRRLTCRKHTQPAGGVIDILGDVVFLFGGEGGSGGGKETSFYHTILVLFILCIVVVGKGLSSGVRGKVGTCE